jgi:hypothetical protein
MGCNITVNIVHGLHFIMQTKMVIDTANQVAKMRAFYTPPFPVNFHCAMCAIPAFNKAKAAASSPLR